MTERNEISVKRVLGTGGGGQRFLANVPTNEATVHPITVVVNWKPGRN